MKKSTKSLLCQHSLIKILADIDILNKVKQVYKKMFFQNIAIS